MREAQGRADLLLQKAQVRLEEIDHDINELKLRRRDAEGSLEASDPGALPRARVHPRPGPDAQRRQAPAPSSAPGRSAAGGASSRWSKSARPRASSPAWQSAVSSSASFRARRAPASTAMRGGAILIRLAAPPVDGAANDALVAFLVGTPSELPRRDIAIVSGEKSRDKRVSIDGMDAAAVQSTPAAIDAVLALCRQARYACAGVLLIRHIRQLITCAGPAPRRGARSADAPNHPRRRRRRRRRTHPLCRAGARSAGVACLGADARDHRRREASPSSRDSSTRTRTRCSPAIGATSCGGGWPARPTPRSRPRAAASSPPCAPRARRPRTNSSTATPRTPRRDAGLRHDDGGGQERLRAGRRDRAEDAARHPAARGRRSRSTSCRRSWARTRSRSTTAAGARTTCAS